MATQQKPKPNPKVLLSKEVRWEKEKAGVKQKRRPPQKKKKQQLSRLQFRLAVLALVGLVALVLCVEFLVDKPAVVWPEGYSVYGIDVSKYQKEVDWQRVRANEISFAFLKATEGASMKDNLFARNWKEAKAAGIVRGAYHFYNPNRDPETQASNFTATVQLAPGDLPPVLDIELRGRKPVAQLRRDLQVWLQRVEDVYGARPIIYTNYKFYVDHLAGHFDGYHLWIAHYKTDQLMLEKSNKLKLAFWQHTDGGAIEGVEGAVDCNVFYGSMRDLKEVCIKK